MAKNIIYYYTGTGNSLSVSKIIANTLTDTVIIPMKNKVYEPIDSGVERIGFIYPNYMSGLPGDVHEFISNMKIDPNIYYFSITVCSMISGNCHGEVNSILKKKGGKLSFFKTILHVQSNLLLTPTLRNNPKKLKKINANVLAAAQSIKNKAKMRMPHNNYICKAVHAIYNPLKRFDFGFHVSEKCTSCNTCAQLCPQKNIQLKDGKPTFLHHCDFCLTCIQYCPQSAIDFMVLTKGRKRYHNPDAPINELMKGKIKCQ